MKTPEPTTNLPEGDDPKASTTLVVALVGALVVFVLIVILQAFFYQAEEGERGRKVVASAPAELAALRAQQVEELNGYRWVDRTRGRARIPIDRAMELTVRDQGRIPALPGQASAQPAPPAGKPASIPAEARP